MCDPVSGVSGLLRNAIQALELARTTYGKTMAVTDGAAALVGYDRDDLIGRLASAAIEAGLDVGTVKAAVEAGKARAEVARQYRESTPPPKPAPRAAQEAGAPTRPGASKGVASPSLCEALRIQAQERDWEISAREAVSRLNEAAAAPSRTAVSTIETLLYELRSGLSCLADEGARNRLLHCDEAAIRTIAAELLSWKSKNEPCLPPWTKEDVAKLLAVKEGLK
jgi:hypothetical protein